MCRRCCRVEAEQLDLGALSTLASQMPLAPQMRELLAELAPRDGVARAIFREQRAGHRVFLDARKLGRKFAKRFPGITAICIARGIDPRHDLIPVTPAAQSPQVPKISNVWLTFVYPCLSAIWSAHRSTAGPTTSTALPQLRQTRWWWCPSPQSR